MPQQLSVTVRVRPPQPHDREAPDSTPCIQLVGEQILASERSFSFDRVLPPTASQEIVYATCALPLVEAVLQGQNGCLFAFGCTGSGKTHSMLGPEGGRSWAKRGQEGVLPRVSAELFRRLERLKAEARRATGDTVSSHEVKVSFIEVYRESAFDLLAGPVSASRDAAASCALREDLDGRVYADGAVEEVVSSTEQLLGLVARGANARATAATGVHAHSSRSHAMLCLTVQHRWTHPGKDQSKKVISRISRVMLVDLAGAETMERSHGGRVDLAGVGTNVGLLVLGRVIRALAEGSDHVPFRDSTLTRLMQSFLGGSAVAHMLACISPARCDLDVTLSTLSYATSARKVQLNPKQSRAVEEIDNSDPMHDDVNDNDPTMQRRAIWIETADFGDVFARCAGDPDDPLILYVHGSGPRNSSMVWNCLVEDVSRLAASGSHSEGSKVPQSYYHVAIDCPGYGRSPGDRQAIRSYPGALVHSVLRALGRRNAAALVGSSQGACAVFNCILEKPKLAHALAVCHPVGHAVHRYTTISQPALLIFDVEDSGHPVSVGRQMMRHLPHPRYFEFSRSRDGAWEERHMGKELCSMLAETWPSRVCGGRDMALPELTRVAGGLRAWSEQHNGECLPWYRTTSDEEEAPAPEQTQAGDVWRAVLDTESNCMLYEHVRSGRRTRIRPVGAHVIVQRLGGAGMESQEVPTAMSESDASEEELLEREAAELLERQRREKAQTGCDVCHQPAIEPMRLSRCRCLLCACCVERTVRYTRQCPACGGKFQIAKDGFPVRDEEQSWAAVEESSTAAQSLLLGELRSRRTQACRLILEYGCESKAAGAKTSFTSFVRVAKVDGALKILQAIARVEFNINPGYSKPTASLREPNSQKLGFSFEYAMVRPFPCIMTVYFQSALSLPCLEIDFETQTTSRLARHIVVDLPSSPSPRASKAQASGKVMVQFGATPPRNGWVFCAAQSGAQNCVDYLPEPAAAS